jgi:hypothetical protein
LADGRPILFQEPEPLLFQMDEILNHVKTYRLFPEKKVVRKFPGLNREVEIYHKLLERNQYLYDWHTYVMDRTPILLVWMFLGLKDTSDKNQYSRFWQDLVLINLSWG